MKLFSARNAVWTPWKNGGGVTRQIAAFPEDSGLDDFGWRISTARVETPGPFSHFACIDRTLAVLEGRLRFHEQGHSARLIGEEDAPLIFSGEARVEAEPVGGGVLDFNVMTRRGRYLSQVRHAAPEHDLAVTSPRAGWSLVYVVNGNCAARRPDDSAPLGPADALLLEPDDAANTLYAAPRCRVIIVTLQRSS